MTGPIAPVGEPAPDRRILRVTGSARESFLQGLVTNDLKRLDHGLVYAAILSPQGKYLFDFLLVPQPDAILIDIAAPFADALARRLTMYRLRADVAIAPTDIPVTCGLGPAPRRRPSPTRVTRPSAGAPTDAPPPDPPRIDWDAIRVEHLIPETGIELIPDDTYILEAGFERLHGVDFRKGCYVGQEVTARMKHKTDLRKGLARVAVDGAAPVGTPIMAGQKEAGTLFTQSRGHAIAHLRFDRAEGVMRAGDARVTWTPEP